MRIVFRDHTSISHIQPREPLRFPSTPHNSKRKIILVSLFDDDFKWKMRKKNQLTGNLFLQFINIERINKKCLNKLKENEYFQ